MGNQPGFFVVSYPYVFPPWPGFLLPTWALPMAD